MLTFSVSAAAAVMAVTVTDEAVFVTVTPAGGVTVRLLMVSASVP